MIKCLIVWVSAIVFWCLFLELFFYFEIGPSTLIEIFIFIVLLSIPYGMSYIVVHYLVDPWDDDFWSTASVAAILFGCLPGIIIYAVLFGLS